MPTADEMDAPYHLSYGEHEGLTNVEGRPYALEYNARKAALRALRSFGPRA